MMSLKNQTGSAILTTIFLLAGMVALGFVGIEIMLSGFSSYMTQEASTQAYYAAEAGMEKALALYKVYRIKHDGASFYHDNYATCAGGNWLVFNTDLATSYCSSISSQEHLPSISAIVAYKRGDPVYSVNVNFADYDASDGDNRPRMIILRSRGQYLNAAREIQVSFCAPLCEVGYTTDGCGGSCD